MLFQRRHEGVASGQGEIVLSSVSLVHPREVFCMFGAMILIADDILDFAQYLQAMQALVCAGLQSLIQQISYLKVSL